MGEGGHGLSLYVSRVSLYRDIDINTSFVFWFVLCQGCICICVQMYFYSDLLHWMELCGSRRRALLLYFCCCQKNSFVLLIWFYFRFLRILAFKHLSPKTLKTDLNFSSWFHVSALAKCGLKWSGAKWIQIFSTNGSMDGRKMSQKLFSRPQGVPNVFRKHS